MKPHLLSLLISSLFSLLGSGLWALPSAANDRPNVLVILADDLGYSDLGCFGGEIPTPNIDRLASGGLRYSAFYNSARCCPSRAALMTGLHPHEAGIGSFATGKPRSGQTEAYTGHLLPDTATMAEILGDAGYSTWMVGKWHMGIPGPLKRGFQNYYGYKDFLAHSENQWDPAKYVRLPESTSPELTHPADKFYVTDVFTDYALEFLQQARTLPPAHSSPITDNSTAPPWLLYLAHSSPHFPIQAPKESIDRHVATYRQGWDVLRAERFERQKKLGLVPADAKLPPLSEVPVDKDAIANGFSGKPNPTWNSLPEDRREDLARRMATFAAMIEHVDQGIGRILADLEKNGELDNTLILFTSDNGACYEWGPFGFGGRSRLGTTTLHKGKELERIGQADTHQSYGSAWANLGNTPLNMYKHFCHEGGIASPLVLHWPKHFRDKDSKNQLSRIITDPTHIMDLLPTVCEATGVQYPEQRNGKPVKPMSGTSLLPTTIGKTLPERTLAFEHQQARGLRKGDWKLVWGKRQPDEITWELFNLKKDRSEQNNLAKKHPELVKELTYAWDTWAKRVGAEPFNMLKGHQPAAKKKAQGKPIANKNLTITVEAESNSPTGVLIAHGGREQGYSLRVADGKLHLDVRVNEKLTTLTAPEKVQGKFTASATLHRDTISLSLNGKKIATAPSPGLIPVEPKDDLNIGRDTLSTVGDYTGPAAFNGKILSHRIKATRPELPK